MGPALPTGVRLNVLLLDRDLPLATASDRKTQLVMMRITAVTIRQFDVDLRMRIFDLLLLKAQDLPPDGVRQSTTMVTGFTSPV